MVGTVTLKGLPALPLMIFIILHDWKDLSLWRSVIDGMSTLLTNQGSYYRCFRSRIIMTMISAYDPCLRYGIEEGKSRRSLSSHP